MYAVMSTRKTNALSTPFTVTTTQQPATSSAS